MMVRIKQVRLLRYVLMLTGLLFCIGSAAAEMAHMQKDGRTEVKFPPMVRDNFLRHMRDHLAAISEIQSALGQGNFKLAADTAKGRLGMDAPSSMACNPGKAKMSQMTRYMPDGMRRAGRVMHHAADQFAVDVKAGDYRTAIAALAKVTHACASCHAQYRVR